MDVKQATAAILHASRQPLVVDTIELPGELEAGQVLVKLHYSTICGAQINEIEAVKGPDKYLPHLLGHEASATVLEIGPGVTTVQTGDTVVLHWRPGSGIHSQPPRYRWGGGTLNAGWVTTFNSHAVVSENRMTPIPSDFDLKVAPLFGCAVTTAAGVIGNDARLKVGESLVVFGAGGVGLNVVQFAAITGAFPIVAVDLVDEKLEMARRFGATHGFSARSMTLEAIDHEVRAVVGMRGPDKVVETTGDARVIEAAYGLTHPEGTCVLVGVPHERVNLYTLPIHFDMVLTGSHGGSARPERDIPRLLRLHQSGRLPLSDLITHEFALDEINDALDVVRQGVAGRVLVSFD